MHSTVLACPCCEDQRLYPVAPQAGRWSLAGRRCLASCEACGGRCLGRYTMRQEREMMPMFAL